MTTPKTDVLQGIDCDRNVAGKTDDIFSIQMSESFPSHIFSYSDAPIVMENDSFNVPDEPEQHFLLERTEENSYKIVIQESPYISQSQIISDNVTEPSNEITPVLPTSGLQDDGNYVHTIFPKCELEVIDVSSEMESGNAVDASVENAPDSPTVNNSETDYIQIKIEPNDILNLCDESDLFGTESGIRLGPEIIITPIPSEPSVNDSSKSVNKSTRKTRNSPASKNKLPAYVFGSSIDNPPSNGKNVRRPRVGVKVPSRNLTSQIVTNDEVSSLLLERWKKSAGNKCVEPPDIEATSFTHSLAARLASKLPLEKLYPLFDKQNRCDPVKNTNNKTAGATEKSKPKVSKPQTGKKSARGKELSKYRTALYRAELAFRKERERMIALKQLDEMQVRNKELSEYKRVLYPDLAFRKEQERELALKQLDEMQVRETRPESSDFIFMDWKLTDASSVKSAI